MNEHGCIIEHERKWMKIEKYKTCSITNKCRRW